MALLAQVPEDLRLGREYALIGNYEIAIVYYDGVCSALKQQIDKLTSPQREQWQEVLPTFYLPPSPIIFSPLFRNNHFFPSMYG